MRDDCNQDCHGIGQHENIGRYSMVQRMRALFASLLVISGSLPESVVGQCSSSVLSCSENVRSCHFWVRQSLIHRDLGDCFPVAALRSVYNPSMHIYSHRFLLGFIYFIFTSCSLLCTSGSNAAKHYEIPPQLSNWRGLFSRTLLRKSSFEETSHDRVGIVGGKPCCV